MISPLNGSAVYAMSDIFGVFTEGLTATTDSAALQIPPGSWPRRGRTPNCI